MFFFLILLSPRTKVVFKAKLDDSKLKQFKIAKFILFAGILSYAPLSIIFLGLYVSAKKSQAQIFLAIFLFHTGIYFGLCGLWSSFHIVKLHPIFEKMVSEEKFRIKKKNYLLGAANCTILVMMCFLLASFNSAQKPWVFFSTCGFCLEKSPKYIL
jgi:hypothetical protein